MKTECIDHRSGGYCSVLDTHTLSVRIKTGKDVERVVLVAGDPYSAGVSPSNPWDGERVQMGREVELRDHFVWKAVVRAEYRRLQYYFEVCCGGETLVMLEDGFYTPQEFGAYRGIQAFFRFPWINESDVASIPAWVKDTVWYQIMPDRFCAAMEPSAKSRAVKPWKCEDGMKHGDFYGGDIPGIVSKLGYIKSLGCSGIYLNPVFASKSYHRYDTDDYTLIDPDLGTADDMKALVQNAHALGIRIMLDAVFNHCGRGFFAWRDVVEKGEASRYKDWFFIRSWPVDGASRDTRDGAYYSFAFQAGMPKLNTDNPEVQEYFERICLSWIREWEIDGIRFDVGNEISHTFIRRLASSLKKEKPDIFLLGEIWHDSAPWLSGGEYDSVMHYPFLFAVNGFWSDDRRTQRDLMFSINRCLVMYRDGIAPFLFTFLGTHDTLRAFNRCGSVDATLQQFAFLLTMSGSPSLFYGDEIPLDGADDLQCRKCMPWGEILAKGRTGFSCEIRKLISLRNEFPQLKSPRCEWNAEYLDTRVVCYTKLLEDGRGGAVSVSLNASSSSVHMQTSAEARVLYAHLYDADNGVLSSNGILIRYDE